MKHLIVLLSIVAGAPTAAAAQQAPPTFYKDVLPILQHSCQTCHRPGEIGRMPLLTYEQTRPWARAIKAAVITRRMPPWGADRDVGLFHNDPSLSQASIETIASWVDAGAPAGDPAAAPPPRQFSDGWADGIPDLVVEMPNPYAVPASGTVEYTYVIVPTGFTEDRWVTSAEFRPGNRAVMHHATVFVREPNSKWLRVYPTGEAFVPAEQIPTANTRRPAATTNAGAGPFDQQIAGYVPGQEPSTLPDDYGMLIPAGSDLVFQLHYTTNGTAALDRSKVGFRFAATPPRHRVFLVVVFEDRFTIPPGAANYAVSGAATLTQDADLLALAPHMHLRGKSMIQGLELPSGERETLLSVSRYEFNWQFNYSLPAPRRLPKGTILHATGTFDNSNANRANPDPSSPVGWGDQSWQEMMVGFFTVGVPVGTDLRSVVKRQ
jgi:hypothetical protein